MSETKPTVIEALSSVMAEVQGIRKGDRNAQQGFNFRGIDAVMNAVGPALRKHGVVIVPGDVKATYRDAQTTTGKAIREVTVLVTYRIYGPAGDNIEMQTIGESLDSGDKGSAKAMSVAYRIALLQALTIPTDEPDPDHSTYERATEDRITDTQMKAMRARLAELGLTDRAAILTEVAGIIGHPIDSSTQLTRAEASKVIQHLQSIQTGDADA